MMRLLNRASPRTGFVSARFDELFEAREITSYSRRDHADYIADVLYDSLWIICKL
jgi:hypothetical protein